MGAQAIPSLDETLPFPGLQHSWRFQEVRGRGGSRHFRLGAAHRWIMCRIKPPSETTFRKMSTFRRGAVHRLDAPEAFDLGRVAAKRHTQRCTFSTQSGRSIGAPRDIRAPRASAPPAVRAARRSRRALRMHHAAPIEHPSLTPSPCASFEGSKPPTTSLLRRPPPPTPRRSQHQALPRHNLSAEVRAAVPDELREGLSRACAADRRLSLGGERGEVSERLRDVGAAGGRGRRRRHGQGAGRRAQARRRRDRWGRHRRLRHPAIVFCT